MFEQMRKNTKTILWVTVAAFVGLIFLAWGADFQLGNKKKMDPGVIGTINGQVVESRVYEQAVTQSRANFQQQYGRDLDDRTEVMIRNQAWNDLVQDALLRAEATRRGITVSDEEVVQAVMTQPPPDVVQNPSFQTNGRFDLAKYQAAIRNPNVDTRALEYQYRSSLPLQKLQMQVIGSVAVSDAELWQAYQAQNEKVKVSYALVPSSKFTVDPAGVTDADMQRYYEAHKSNYRLPDQASIEYVMIPRKYTDTDSLNLIQLGHQVVSEFKGGEDFTTLVEAYSEAPANMRGGSAGAYVTASQISDPVVRQAAFALKPGEVSDVLLSPGGVHIIKVEDRKTDPAGDQVKLADVYLPLKPSNDTVSQLSDEARQFRQEVDKRAFNEVAGEMKLSVKETPPFGESGFIPGLGPSQEVQDFVFSHAAGTISPVFETPEGWVIVRVKERRPAHTADLAEVQDRVRTETADSLRCDQAAAVAEGILRQVQAGTPIASAGANDSRVTHDSPEPFGLLGFARGIGGDPTVTGQIFAVPGPGVIPKVLRGRMGAMVVVVEQKIPADKTQFEAQKQQERMTMLQRRQSQVFNDWLTALKKNAKVEDYRFGQVSG